MSVFIPFARLDLAGPSAAWAATGVPAVRGPFVRGIAVSG